ncbi:hypothetical protein MTO96_003529 [Rhipicephalus appendiculatus]
MTDYMYARLQRIRRASYRLSDDDVVDWLIQGVRSTSAKPMLAAFHDLRRGTISEFLHYVQQMDRRDVGVNDDMRAPAASKTSKPSERNAAESTTTTTPKYTRLPADTCARCKKKGHRAIACPDLDTRTEEEKAAAAKRREERVAREQRTHRIVTTRTEGRIILVPTKINGVETLALWDTGSTATLVSSAFAEQHNFDVVPDTYCVLRGPFGDSTTPVGATQGHIAIEEASATIGVKVVNDLPHDAVIGTDWRECVTFDYIERYTNGMRTLEWIPKNSPQEAPKMEHRRNDITPQPAHKNDNEETDAATSVAVTLNSSPKQVHPNLPSLEEVRREIAQVQPANFDTDQTEKNEICAE